MSLPNYSQTKAKSAKLAAMAGLGAASMESYGRAYPFVARLHAVREVEHAREYIKGGDLNELERRWDARREGRRGVVGPVVVKCEEAVSGSLWRSSESWRCLHGGGYASEEGWAVDRRAR